MKSTFICFPLIFLFSFSASSPTADFEGRMNTIIQAFKQALMDKDQCKALVKQAQVLEQDITKALAATSKKGTARQLKKLKIEASALVLYLGMVGGTEVHPISTKQLYLINRWVKAKITNVSQKRFCVNILKVNIGNYTAHLVENPSDLDYQVNYNWRIDKSISTDSGSGQEDVDAHRIYHIHNNRKKAAWRSIDFYDIKCYKR